MATTYTIRDTNSSDSGLNFSEAVERIASWYEDADQWADGQGDREVRTTIRTAIKSVEQPSEGDIDTLQAYADAVCDAVAKAMGHKEFAGQPSFGVASAAECGGFRLTVTADETEPRVWTCSYNGQSVDVVAATVLEAKSKAADQLSVGVRGFLDLDAIDAE